MKRLSFAWLLLAAASPLGAQTLQVRLDSPSQHSEVPWRACVEGWVSDPKALVRVSVHPLVGSDHWIQPTPSVRPDGRFKVMLYFGADSSIRHEGEAFEVMALANPQARLSEGQVLPILPAAEAQSGTIEVVRNARASSRCVESPVADRAMSDSNPAPSWTPIASATGQAASPVRADVWPDELSRSVALCLLLLGLFTFIAAIFMRDRTERMATQLAAWTERLAERLGAVWTNASTRLQGLFTHQVRWLSVSVPAAWRAIGYKGKVSDAARSILLTAALVVLVWLGFIADSLGNRAGMELLFAVENGAALVSGIFSESDQASNDAWGQASLRSDWWTEPLVNVWNSPLGPFAIGLAATQALFGLVLWGRIKQSDAVQRTVWRLVRERPVVTLSFFALNIGVAGLAAFRAYELSPSAVPWVLAAAVAALISAVVPWIQAYGLHYLVESAEEVLTVVLGAMTAIVLVSASGVLLVVWAAVLFMAVAATGVWLACAWFATAVLTSLFWTAALLGEFLEKLYDSWKVRREEAPSLATSPIVLRLLAFLAVTGLVAAALRAEAPTAHLENKPYQAWILCIDVSTSVSSDEFARLKRVLEKVVKSDVRGNDLVWLLSIGSDTYSPRLFEIPPSSNRRSQASESERRMADAKQELLAAIRELQQVAVQTHLGPRIELAMNLFRPHSHVPRNLIMGGDFISDLGNRKITPYPPNPTARVSAQGVRVALLLTHPTQEYLADLKVSQAQLFQIVASDWRGYFDRLGARVTSVRLVDAVPVN